LEVLGRGGRVHTHDGGLGCGGCRAEDIIIDTTYSIPTPCQTGPSFPGEQQPAFAEAAQDTVYVAARHCETPLATTDAALLTRAVFVHVVGRMDYNSARSRQAVAGIETMEPARTPMFAKVYVAREEAAGTGCIRARRIGQEFNPTAVFGI
jgi:hypothetical protein